MLLSSVPSMNTSVCIQIFIYSFEFIFFQSIKLPSFIVLATYLRLKKIELLHTVMINGCNIFFFIFRKRILVCSFLEMVFVSQSLLI
jgi:hypothetical protein